MNKYTKGVLGSSGVEIKVHNIGLYIGTIIAILITIFCYWVSQHDWADDYWTFFVVVYGGISIFGFIVSLITNEQ